MKLTKPQARMLLKASQRGWEELKGSLPRRDRLVMGHALTRLQQEVGELEARDRLTEAQMELRVALHRLWLEAGEPSVRQMARQIEPARSHMSWHYALKCDPVPSLGVLRALVSYLDGDLGRFEELWFRAKGMDRTM